MKALFFLIAGGLFLAAGPSELSANADTHTESHAGTHAESPPAPAHEQAHSAPAPAVESTEHVAHEEHAAHDEHAVHDEEEAHHGPEIIAVPANPVPQVVLSAANWPQPKRIGSIDPVTSGSPDYVHYSPEMFGGATDFRGVAQHADGRTYVIVGPHLYVGTGTRWQPVPTAPEGELHSLYLATGNRLYVSSSEDFGYLDLTSAGNPKWHSIRRDLPVERIEGHVWKARYEDAAGSVYFTSDETIIAHHPVITLQIWQKIAAPDHIFSLHGKIYTLTRDLKVYRLDALGRSEIVQRDLPLKFGDIRDFASYDDNHLIVAAGAAGLALYNGEIFQPFAIKDFENSSLLIDQLIPLGKETYAAIDFEKGLLIFGADGTLLRQIQRIGDLKIRITRALTIDRQGWMWLAHPSGLYRVNVVSKGMSFTHHAGLEGSVRVICEHEDAFYAGTSVGLFRWNGAQFEQVVGAPAVESLVSTDNGLAIGTRRGLYVHHKDNTYLVDKGERPSVFQSPQAPAYLLTPTPGGVDAYNLFSHRWRPALEWANLPTSGGSVVTDVDGNLWGEYGPGRLAFFKFTKEDTSPRIFTPKEGLPLAVIRPVRLGDEMVFLAGKDLLRLLPNGNGFTRSPGWEQQDFAFAQQPAKIAIESAQGKTWIPVDYLGNTFEVFPPEAMKYAVDDILAYATDPLNLATFDSAGHYWVGNSRGLRRYLGGLDTSDTRPTPVTLIHRIESNGEILADFAAGTSKAVLQGLSARTNNIRITYSVLEYGEPRGVTYTTFLKGYNTAWQPFTGETVKEYMSLRPGAFTFNVLARTTDGREASPAVVEFQIPVAFSDTPAAKLIGFLAAIVLIGVMLFVVHKVAARKIRKLENTLSNAETQDSNKTKELEEKNKLLDKAIAEKKKISDEKDLILSQKAQKQLEIGQKLRPPATLLSQLSYLLPSDGLSVEARNILKGLRLTCESLVGGMREILDVRSLELKQLQEQTIEYNLQDLLDEILESISGAANGLGVELNCQIDQGLKLVRCGNPTRVKEVITPLVVTALKDIEEGELTVHALNAEGQSADFVCFSVRVKGLNWDDSSQEQILKASDPENPPRYRGKAQGIAVARHLMKPMKGTFKLHNNEREKTYGYEVSLSQPPAAEQPSKKAEDLPFSQRLVLIIDDNPISLKSLQSVAERMGFQTRLANDTPQAKEALKDTPKPDLIWVDAKLGDEDGYSLLETIRAIEGFEALPALFMASTVEIEHSEKVVSDPLSLLIAKPASRLLLEAACEGLLYPAGRGKQGSPVEAIEEADAPQPKASEPVAEDEDPIEAKIRAALAKSAASAEVDDAEPLPPAPSVLIADAQRPRGIMLSRILKHFRKDAKLVSASSEVLGALENAYFDILFLTHPLDHTETAKLIQQIRDSIPEERRPIVISMGVEFPEGTSSGSVDDHLRFPLSISALDMVLRLAQLR